MITNIPHVTYNLELNCFECSYCEEQYWPSLPAPIDLLLAIMKAWKNLHRGCKPNRRRKSER